MTRSTAAKNLYVCALLLAGCLSVPPPLEVSDGAVPVSDAGETPNTHSVKLVAADNHYLVTATAPTNLNVMRSFTFEAWFKLARLPLADERFMIFNKTDDDSGENSYQLELMNQGGIYRIVARAEGTILGSGSRQTAGWNWGAPDTSTWHHIAVSYDLDISPKLDRFLFHLDGALVTPNVELGSVGDDITAIRQTASPLTVGAWVSGGTAYRLFDGELDEIRIWNRVRSAPEIASNYMIELRGDEPDLLGYWQFDNSLADATSNGNTLTIVGTPAPSFVLDRPF